MSEQQKPPQQQPQPPQKQAVPQKPEPPKNVVLKEGQLHTEQKDKT